MPEAVYLNKSRAEQAIALAEPAILQMLRTVCARKALHIVVMGTDGAVLHQQNVGIEVEADRERLAICAGIARSKAEIHLRTGRPSAEIQSRRPNELLVGDTIWGGSASHEGVIVGISGVQGYFDESIAAIVAAILWGLCMDAQAGYMAKADKATIYKGTA